VTYYKSKKKKEKKKKEIHLYLSRKVLKLMKKTILELFKTCD